MDAPEGLKMATFIMSGSGGKMSPDFMNDTGAWVIHAFRLVWIRGVGG
jgi:hypothetical protein